MTGAGIRITIDGDLGKSLAGRIDDIASAATAAVNNAAEACLTDLRDQTTGAGLGGALANAWQMLPAGGAKPFAALVYSKAPLIHDAFIKGVTIAARNAQWLVLPLKAAAQYGLDKARPSGASARGSAGRYSNVDAAIDMFGELRFVMLPGGGRGVLFGDPTNLHRPRGAKTGPIGSRGGGTKADIPLFLLVRSVHLAKRIDLDGAVAAAQDRLNRGLSNIAGG